MHGAFCWNELATDDIEKARTFYEATLGWTFEPFALPDGLYWIARSGDTIVAGVGGFETGALETKTPYWFSFIEVDDLDGRVARAVELGATVLRGPEDVPNVGRVAVIKDPTGAAIGWMTGATG